MSNVIESNLAKESDDVINAATAIVVVDSETYGQMGAVIKSAKDVRKKRWGFFQNMIDAATASLESVRKERADAVAPLDQIIADGTKAQNTWLAAEDARKRAEQARLEAEAREAARKERERLQKAAEKAEAKGNAEKAEELIEQAAEVIAEPVFAAPIVTAPVKTGDATSFTVTETEITVIDLKAFLKALVDGNHAPTMITVGVAPLKAWVKAGAIEHFPGLHIKKVTKARNR